MNRRVLVGRLLIAAMLVLAAPIAHAQATADHRAQAFIGLARVKRDAGDMPAARRYFDEAAHLRPLTLSERTEYFWILQAVDAEAACTAGRNLLRGMPSDHRVRERTIGLAIDLGREDLVVALAEEGARVQPGMAVWPQRLAESHVRQKRSARAQQSRPPAVTSTTPATTPTNVTARATPIVQPSTEKPAIHEAAALPAPVELAIAASTFDSTQALMQQLSLAPVALDREAPAMPVASVVEEAAPAARDRDPRSIAAERDAKSAFLSGRWQAAADAYRRLIALEPDNGEARFEYAQSLRAAGQVREADLALKELADSSLHETAVDAWTRVQRTRRPRMAFLFDTRAAAGFGGQRLLERQTEEAAFLATGGSTAATQFDLSAGRATLRGADGSRHGYHALLGFSSRLSPRLDVAARADLWDVWQNGDASVEGALQFRYRTGDRWTLTGSLDRSLLFENLEVVDRRLAAAGATAGLRFDSPTAGFEAGSGWHQLSDGNARWRTSMFYHRVISQRVRNLRALVWAEALSFRESSPLYYSPHAQIRVDVGAQYTHDLRLQRFRGDRVNAITGAYLIGTDRDGVIYHHPSLRASFELRNGFAFEARADWIRSTVYNDRSVSFGLAFRGTGSGR